MTTATKAVAVQQTESGSTVVIASKDTTTLMSTVAVTASGYAVLELIHHGLIQGYLVPWLMSLGLSATALMYLTYGLLTLSVVGVAYLIFRWFVKNKE